MANTVNDSVIYYTKNKRNYFLVECTAVKIEFSSNINRAKIYHDDEHIDLVIDELFKRWEGRDFSSEFLSRFQ